MGINQMLRSLLLVACLVLACFAASQADSVTAISARPGFYRQLTVSGSPSTEAIATDTATGIAVVAVGVDADSDSVNIDAAGFAFRNPEDDKPNDNGTLSFYFGYFDAKGDWNPDTKTGTASASLAELLAYWHGIYVWYDGNGQPGFQWDADSTHDPYDCAEALANNLDCIEPNAEAFIEFTKIGWSGIITTKSACPEGYRQECAVYTMTTSSTGGVITFTLHLASEPVLINGVRVDPDFSKIDVEIKYPWASKTLRDANNARVGILAATAGKAGSVGAQSTQVDGKQAFTFTRQSKTAYFSWDASAKVDNGEATVYFQGISDYTITNKDCSADGCSIGLSFFIGLLKILVGYYKAFGWATELIYFSWNEVRPATVFWDPALGVQDSNAAAGAAFSLAPTTFLIATLLALFFVVRRR